MVTQGLIKELAHISNFFRTPVKCGLFYSGRQMEIEVSLEVVKLLYKGQIIWEENTNDEVGNFGIESVQHIFYIVEMIDSGQPYERLIYREDCSSLNEFSKKEQQKCRKDILDFVEKTRQETIQNNDI